MGELGEDGVRHHQQCGRLALEQGVDCLFTVGQLAREAGRSFGSDSRHFNNIAELGDHLRDNIHECVVLLIKGSRAAGLDQLLPTLSDGEASC